MKTLVIGATGFIGSNVARHLQARGHGVSGLSRSAAGDAGLRNDGVEPIRGDLDRLDELLAITDAFDTIVYVAQLLLEPEHATIAALLDRLADTGKTLIFTSGTGVLSERTDGDWSENSFAEADTIVPSKYIGFRHETEKRVMAAGASGRLRAMVLRPPLIWGHGRCGQVQAFYQCGLKTGEVCYLGRGLNLYSNVHVDDLAEVYRLAIERGTSGALYHAVSGETTNGVMAAEVARIMELPLRSVDFAQAAEIWGKFTALIAMSTCSRSRSPRTRAELGWTPRKLDFMEDIANPAYLEAARAWAATSAG